MCVRAYVHARERESWKRVQRKIELKGKSIYIKKQKIVKRVRYAKKKRKKKECIV